MAERTVFLRGSSASVEVAPCPDGQEPRSWLVFCPGLAPLVVPHDWAEILFELEKEAPGR